MITHAGIARCKIVLLTDMQTIDIPEGCTWNVRPIGLTTPTPDTSPECIIEFSTKGDRLAELEAHAGILYIFEYEEIA